jgi:hypothetical protein
MASDYNDGKSSTFGRELMSYISSKLPYSGFDVTKLTDNLNPKYKYFEHTGLRRAEVLSRHSVSQDFEFNNQSVSNITSDKRYSDVMYANIQKDKLARVRDYRIMAAFSEVANALDEICDETINIDSHSNSCFNLKFKNIALSNFQIETLNKEFYKYVSYFDFEHKGWSYFRQLLVEGEIYWEHIIHKDYPEEGILGVVQIPTELVDPVFSNVQNVMVKGYLYRKPKFDPHNPLKQVGVDFVPMDKNQITYVNSDVWNENKTMRLPFLENARRAYRQLSMIEDSIVIYRLARAPERLVFNVDVGNMPAPKAEAYLRKLVTQYWSSKTYDPDQGGIVQKFKPQSILDNFWFAKRAGSEGTSVTQLAGACLAMDTNVLLLDGRTLSIREIEQELKTGKELWTYSVDYKNGNVKDGIISWAGVTQESADVLEITFSNNKKVICTLDHKFPIYKHGFVEAKYLVVNQKMMGFNNDNIVIKSIEKLPNKMEVGTLTIDNDEKYHDYHTFALDCGVFTKNSNLGELQDLMYFVKKLYQSLKVPTTRLDPQDAFRDGADMLREELKFARFIIRLQQLFAGGIKNGFITHLQMKGMWKEFELKEDSVLLDFNVPTNFYELRESQKLELKVANFGSMASNESISPSFAQKRYLGWTDIDVKANREFLRKDKELRWELTQIETLGPNWRELMEAQAEAQAGGMGGEAGAPPPAGGGGGGGGGMPPPFSGGPAGAPTPESPPEAGEAGAAPEGGAAPSPQEAAPEA